jgi:hypothetical protein
MDEAEAAVGVAPKLLSEGTRRWDIKHSCSEAIILWRGRSGRLRLSAINEAGSSWMLAGDCPLAPPTTDPGGVGSPVAVHAGGVAFSLSSLVDGRSLHTRRP